MSKEINEAVERGLLRLDLGRVFGPQQILTFGMMEDVLKAMRCEEKVCFCYHGTYNSECQKHSCFGDLMAEQEKEAIRPVFKTAPQDDDPIVKIHDKYKAFMSLFIYPEDFFMNEIWQAIEQYVKAKNKSNG